jgi:hypothetical protein
LTRDWPPSLSAVASWLTAANSYAEFKDLVQQYVPQQAEAIYASEEPVEMVTAFAQAFQQQYFPLLGHVIDGDCEGFEDIVTAIPVRVQGWEYEEYHELPEDRQGIVLAALLVDFEAEMGEEGIRITLLEKAQEWLPRDLLKRTRAYDGEFLGFALKKRYKGLLCFAAHLLHCTGLYFLDTPMDEIYGMGCRATGPPNWEAETVSSLAQEWKVAQDLMDEEEKFWTWLEKDPKARLAEVVAFLEEKWQQWSKKKPKKH